MTEGKKGKKSVVMAVHYYVVDQDEISDKTREYARDSHLEKFLEIPLPGFEGATMKDAHTCDPRVPEDRRRFTEILYNHACVAVMGEPDRIYILHKDEK